MKMKTLIKICFFPIAVGMFMVGWLMYIVGDAKYQSEMRKIDRDKNTDKRN
jgi:hypothetical protein